ncbi:hypothetical protein GH5_06046 [Leishmania sp. Ghana 2012 LV757]|uniref:hypothetical protein n=1 Tax=Leishmania sp. Ghana 2012 LV757 TaxID=2803181 RepID=UPI001B717192|nr:hypothetical protein GH5_06046 [Leishmania sp. Ghana 2012 LV757]
MRITAESSSERHPGNTCPPIAAGTDETAVVWHAFHTAKTQHALSLFANLRAGLRTSTLPQSPESAAHATSATQASSATRGCTSAPSSEARTLGHGGRLTLPTTAVAPNGNTARFSSLNGLRREGSRSGADDATVPQTYTDAELESLSPAQLRHQLRVAAAVAQRLHQRSRRLESELESWKHRYAAREAKAGPGMGDAGMQEDSKELPKPSASPQDGVDPRRSAAIISSSTAAAATAASEVAAAAAQAPEAAEERTRQLETAVRRLEAHKEVLTKRLYAAEQTVVGLREELRGAMEASRVTCCAASTPPGAVSTITGQHTTEKSLSEALESGAAVVALAPAPPSPSGAATKTERAGRCSDGLVGVDATGGVSVAHLRNTVHQLQRRLDLSEARARQAVQIQLDALLLHCKSTPSSVALVNAEVQRLFQLMQEQLLSNTVQQQVERARMSELLCQLQFQRPPP